MGVRGFCFGLFVIIVVAFKVEFDAGKSTGRIRAPLSMTAHNTVRLSCHFSVERGYLFVLAIDVSDGERDEPVRPRR